MSSPANPYEPPPAKAGQPIIWDRMVFSQVAFGFHLILLGAIGLLLMGRAESAYLAAMEKSSVVRIGLVTAVATGFICILFCTLSKTQWPMHQRLILVAIDGVLVACLFFVVRVSGWI